MNIALIERLRYTKGVPDMMTDQHSNGLLKDGERDEKKEALSGI